ncbi:hypothetical protein D7V93_01440 [Corallococcus llansteffanensis]|uniref:Uncharacterized protein n=1 Tax=Corallococcus llansteffanensis TaxID=2316731 RepID=A0A3A8QIM4_9BACT|nr:hypothetical protein D7V93_01440 [Corallococcus llansteffanensis]
MLQPSRQWRLRSNWLRTRPRRLFSEGVWPQPGGQLRMKVNPRIKTASLIRDERLKPSRDRLEWGWRARVE